MPVGVKIGKTDARINVEWVNLLKNLTKIGTNGILAYFGLADGGGSATSAALSTLDSISVDEPKESKAWALVALSFALAIEDLRPKLIDDNHSRQISSAFKGVRDRTKEVIEAKSYQMESSFFDQPCSLELYGFMRGSMIEGLASLRLNSDSNASELGAQLDAAFNKAVFELTKSRPDYFKSLHEAIKAPGVGAATLELDWEAYRSRLIHQFEVSPVFGQEDTKISLSQLYLPLRAKWHEKPIKVEQGIEAESPKPRYVDLHVEIEKWIKSPRKGRLIKLICGGPGSGKSSFAKAIAASLARRSDKRPLLIELQHLSFEDRLEEEIPEVLVSQMEAFRENPIDKNSCDKRRPLVFIFDGLDELARPGGKGADELARDFASWLDRLLDRLNGEKEIRAIAIVTGRNPIIQALQQRTDGLNPRDVLETVGYAPVPKRTVGEKQTELAKLDQRPLWWSKYAVATGKQADTPDAFNSEKLQDLTNEPLLCYLLAYSDYIKENWEEAGENSNRIYETLLSRVWERGWGGWPGRSCQSFKRSKRFRHTDGNNGTCYLAR